jgi:hypothetical protein
MIDFLCSLEIDLGAAPQLVPYESICVQNGLKIFCNARKAFDIKAFERMNGDSTFYDFFASGWSG